MLEAKGTVAWDILIWIFSDIKSTLGPDSDANMVSLFVNKDVRSFKAYNLYTKVYSEYGIYALKFIQSIESISWSS